MFLGYQVYKINMWKQSKSSRMIMNDVCLNKQKPTTNNWNKKDFV